MGASPVELKVHERLTAGHPTASAEAVEILLPHLVQAVRYRLRSTGNDQDALEGAAIEALLSYVQRPEMYDPRSTRLLSFLTLVATRDYLNWVRKESRHRRGRVPLEFVENSDAGGNHTQMNSAAIDLEERLDLRRLADECAVALEEELPSAIDQAVLNLILDGERRTAVYANVIGLPASDPGNAAIVKRTKDRILKKLHRLRGRIDAR